MRERLLVLLAALIAATLPSATAMAAADTTTSVLGVEFPPWLVNPLQILVVLTLLWWAHNRFSQSDVYERLKRTLALDVMSNWRLVLLAITGIVLSLASGWTTWEGMTNFTKSPILSLLITFGIQGVMLIAAWLIGETFAHGFTASGKGANAAGQIVWMLFILVASAIVVILAIIFWGDSAINYVDGIVRHGQEWGSLVGGSIFVLVAVSALLYAVSSQEIIGPYIRGTKIILKSLPLWLMFLACMATSVFFSFDSLFDAVFPQNQRERVAELRIRNQVAGVISDVGARLQKRRGEAVERLFESDGWTGFNGDLSQLVQLASTASSEVRDLKMKQVEAQFSAEQKERVAISQSKIQRNLLEAEQKRLQQERTAFSSGRRPEQERVRVLAEERRIKADELLVAEGNVKGEARGVRGTGNSGRGPEWRKLRKLAGNLRLELEETDSKLKAARRRLAAINDQNQANETRLKQIVVELVKIDATEQSAKARLDVQASAQKGNIAGDLDAAGGLRALDGERTTFRRDPTRASFDRIQNLCGALLATVNSVPTLRSKTTAINCEPKEAADAAAIVFAFNDARAAYGTNCAAGSVLASKRSANGLLKFGTNCIQDSGLPGNDTAEFRDALNYVALNRDDKAHRFVVTVNAFSDGNKLAYLALAIAIAIDGLVFMSGLFGANAVRSPLTDAQHHSDRTPAQLEASINNSLGPDGLQRYATAQLVLSAMQPITNIQGYMADVQLSRWQGTSRARIQRVLTAGSTMNSVVQDPKQEDRYLIRSEFFEYLNLYCDRQLQADPTLREKIESESAKSERQRINAEQLREVVEAAFYPEVAKEAGLVLEAMKPTHHKDGYSSIIDLNYIERADGVRVDFDDKQRIRKALNAGTAYNFVRPKDNKIDVFEIRNEFYRCIVLIRKQALEAEAAQIGDAKIPFKAPDALTGPPVHPALDYSAVERPMLESTAARKLLRGETEDAMFKEIGEMLGLNEHQQARVRELMTDRGELEEAQERLFNSDRKIREHVRRARERHDREIDRHRNEIFARWARDLDKEYSVTGANFDKLNKAYSTFNDLNAIRDDLRRHVATLEERMGSASEADGDSELLEALRDASENLRNFTEADGSDPAVWGLAASISTAADKLKLQLNADNIVDFPQDITS